MNYIYDEMVELGADGVVFHSIFTNKEDIFNSVKILKDYTISDIKNTNCFPRSDRTYYKIIDSKRVYI